MATENTSGQASKQPTLGKTIRRARQQYSISLGQLAAAIGRDPSYLSKIEKDAYKQPSPDVLYQIAMELGLEYKHLLLLSRQRIPEDLPPMATYLAKKYGLDEAAAMKLAAQFREILSDHYATKAKEVKEGD
jgi:transcriptional regulator with XRE-family HTH domain